MVNRYMKKMLNTTIHERNANQTTMSHHLRPIRMAIIKKTTKKGVHKNMKKRELLCTLGGSTSWSSHYGKQYGGFSRIKKKKYHIILQSHF